MIKVKLLLTILFCFLSTFTFAVEKNSEDEKPENTAISRSTKKEKRIFFSKVVRSFPKVSKILNRIKSTQNIDSLLWILGGLALLAATFWIAGAGVWLIIFTFLGLLAYSVYLVLLMIKFIDDSYLDWYWWAITGIIVISPVILTAIYLTISAALSLLTAILWTTLIVITAFLIIWLIYSFLKFFGRIL